MKNKPARRERYLRDPLPIRLGGIAANLARVVSCADNVLNHRAVKDMLYESKLFIEWAAPSAPADTAVVMLELQRAIVRWERCWTQTPTPSTVPEDIIPFARQWSDRLIEMSGLLEETPTLA